MQVGSNLPVQYTPQAGNVPGQTNTAVNKSSSAGSAYPYGEDVFTGPYQIFKQVYSNFDAGISKFSPFYGKMASSPKSSGPTGQAATDLPPIPGSALTPVQNAPVTQDAGLTPPSQLPGNQQVQTQAAAAPKKVPPSGPALNNIQQLLQDEVQKITSPQKATEVIANHAMLSRQERTMANDIAWGARYYANKAAEMSEKLVQGKANLSPGQIQGQLRTIENYKIKSISLLNDAKKRAINNYNEALKATLLYNNYFTENGQYASILGDNDRKFVESELDKTWTTWNGGFDKEWKGQTAHADESPTVIDKAAREIAIAIDKADKLVETVK
jgi:hypothetical protein